MDPVDPGQPGPGDPGTQAPGPGPGPGPQQQQAGKKWTREEALEVVQEFRDLCQDLPKIMRGSNKQKDAALDKLREIQDKINDMRSQGVT